MHVLIKLPADIPWWPDIYPLLITISRDREPCTLTGEPEKHGITMAEMFKAVLQILLAGSACFLSILKTPTACHRRTP